MSKSIKALQKKVDKLSKTKPTASQKAQKKYSKKINSYYLRFKKDVDKEIWEYLNKQDNKSDYIKNLIYQDMKKALRVNDFSWWHTIQ